MIVGNLRYVQQTTHTAYIYEGTVGFDSANRTNHHLADFQSVHLALNQRSAVRENQTIAVFVYFQEFQRQFFPYQVFLGFAGADVRARNKATQALNPH